MADIREALARIKSYLQEVSYEMFLNDKKTQDAVIRNIEILGEATKRLSQNFRDQNAAVPWKTIAGTRDRLIHDYFGVNLDVVWNIVTSDLPALNREIEQLRTDDEDS